MPSYRVVWEIDAEADTPREAAEWALSIQRKPGSSAVVFDVHDGTETTRVDLDQPESEDATT